MRILALTQRVPHRPDRGDRIRAHHLLKRLGRRHEITLGSLDDEGGRDAPWPQLNEFCRGRAIEMVSRAGRLKEATVSLLRGEPLSFAWFRSGRLLHTLLDWHRREPFDVAYVFSSSMAPYWLALDQKHPLPLVMDFVDVDSLKWGQYADAARGPKRWIYRREQRLLRQWERRLTELAHRSLLVNEAEVRAFREVLGGGVQDKVEALGNGVDAEAFTRPDGYEARPGRRVVFTGMMDYHANADAVVWFARQVWPLLLARHEDLEFEIVGARPTVEVRRLGDLPGVTVTGRVDEVRVHLWDAQVAVVPLRIAQGTQNKVLEAMAASTPVVATSMAVRGIGQPRGPHVKVADTPEDFADAVCELLDDPERARRQVMAAREMIRAYHDWDRSAARLETILQEAADAGGGKR